MRYLEDTSSTIPSEENNDLGCEAGNGYFKVYNKPFSTKLADIPKNCRIEQKRKEQLKPQLLILCQCSCLHLSVGRQANSQWSADVSQLSQQAEIVRKIKKEAFSSSVLSPFCETVKNQSEHI